jgi:hypothetical protein
MKGVPVIGAPFVFEKSRVFKALIRVLRFDFTEASCQA